MKASQLEEGKTYQNKKGLRRTIRQITGDKSNPPNHVFYIEEGDTYVRNIPQQEFAAWAKTGAVSFPFLRQLRNNN